MNAITAIYLVSVLDNLGNAATWLAILGIIGAAIVTAVTAISASEGSLKEESKPYWRKVSRKLFYLGFLGIALTVISPSRPYVAAMAAVYVGQEIAGTETATRLGAKGVDVLEKFMDDYLTEEKPQPKNNGGHDV